MSDPDYFGKLAKTQSDAARVPELEARIAELEAERNYERYRVDKLTAEIEGLRNDSI